MEQSRRDEIKYMVYREGAKTQEWKKPGMDWNQNTRWPCVYLSQMRKRLLASVTLHWSLVTPSLCSSFSQSRGLRKLGARESAALGGDVVHIYKSVTKVPTHTYTQCHS